MTTPANGWQCLVCFKLHPDDDPYVEMACETCETTGLGHPDDHAECRDCVLDRMAEFPQEED